MDKIKIANGMYWVGIPEAGLYILCGCPADSVKHLMKRGLIVQGEKDGIKYETGPNAILLSEVSIQNGSFSNLAEFPVLQMFYRQGMLLPNHPNNTGIKPMLIGLEEQVKAQSQYIYRGNYGLTSVKEIMETGASEELAGEVMRFKLRFAFDKIRKTEELIDFRVIDKEVVELKNGVLIHRTGFNRYEFYYNGGSVNIDLNLANGEAYEPTYKLSFHEIKKEYFSVIHTGEGDGWDIYRPCMSSILIFQGRIYLIDAGPNIIHSLTALGISTNEVEGIFHTHAHDDHFAGLTTLIRSDHLIKHYATSLVRASVVRKLSALMSMDEERFEKYFKIYDLEFDKWNDIEGLEVMPVLSPHPVETSIMFFRALWEGGYKTYAHLADIISFDVLKGMIENDPKKSGVPERFYSNIRKVYLTAVDLKKIDIGGGMIHGKAEDFMNDTSSEIILSHTALDLTDSQKEIGSSASFGMVDVLIPAQQDYSIQSAFFYLRSYYPAVPSPDLHMLMNFPIVSFNAGLLLVKKGTVNKYLYLILNGVVEFIDSETGLHNMLSAGSLVGEMSGLTGEASRITFRSASYIRAIKIPCDLFIEFVKRNNLYDEIGHLQETRMFLRRTWLFGELTSCIIQNRIANEMKEKSFREGEALEIAGEPVLFLLNQGEVRIFSENQTIENISKGAFFGEEKIVTGTKAFFKASAVKPSKVFIIPGSTIAEIPVTLLKLQETFEKRIRILETRFSFEWRKEYSVNVKELDEQHKTLFEKLSRLHEAFQNQDNKRIIDENMAEVINYTKYHMSHEESLMKKYDYPEYFLQKEEHEQLIKTIDDFMDGFKRGDANNRLYLFNTAKHWLLRHTLLKDRKYSAFFNDKGLF